MESQAQPVVVPTIDQIKVPGYLKLGRIVSYVVKIWVTIGIFALVMRIFLLLTAANPATPFVDFVYDLSADYMRPFTGIFPAKAVGGASYFDVSAAFAIIVYLFLMWGISELISVIDARIQVYKAKQVAEIKELQRQQDLALREEELAAQQAQTAQQAAQQGYGQPVTIAETVATDTIVHTQEIKQSKPKK